MGRVIAGRLQILVINLHVDSLKKKKKTLRSRLQKANIECVLLGKFFIINKFNVKDKVDQCYFVNLVLICCCHPTPQNFPDDGFKGKWKA